MIGDVAKQLFNRELSWLDFNARVLALAADGSLPLLERIKFLAIFNRNLDEFFQIRVGALKEQLDSNAGATSPDAMSPGAQLRAIRSRIDELLDEQTRLLEDDLLPLLAGAGICFVDHSALDGQERGFLDKMFAERIFPVLTPLAVDPAHPFPYVSSLSLNLAVLVSDPKDCVLRIARLKVPPLLPRFVELPDGRRFVPIEQVIGARLDALFPGMQVLSRNAFRVTRNADFALDEDEAEDLLEAVETVLRLRRRSPHAVRLEIHEAMSEDVRTLLVRELEVDASDVYVVAGLIDLGGLWTLYDRDRPDLKFKPWTPVTQTRLTAQHEWPSDIFGALKESDLLVHHPYDSFATSVQAFIDQAASDPSVMAIKQTVYRTSVVESPIIRALIRAAEAGKQVVAVIEVTARFDEEANIGWARVLEEAGVHVVYGMVGFKTHAKIALVVRREEEGIRRYSHVSTGNYNPRTATMYEDLGLLSANPELGADLADLFNVLTGYSRHNRYTKLVVSPDGMRSALVAMIREQAGRPAGKIVIKVNNLVDKEIINELYAASSAGTQIDCIVRAICCLRPGVPGMSENIRVRSILGRFLEHSRIFLFGAGADAKYYLGSADLMPRNLDRRVEAIVPVEEPAVREHIERILALCLRPNVLAWALDADGSWTKNGKEPVRDMQEAMQELAWIRAQRAADIHD